LSSELEKSATTKKLGGLGILDLSKFNMALRLRLLWYKWKEPNKPWANMAIRHTETEESLFRAATAITLGNGKSTKFWHDRWVQGQSPKELAPKLYKLAWRKSISVADGIQDNKWTRGLQQIANTEEINQFVELWQRVCEVNLSTQEDGISWRFSANRLYSSSSAYAIQIFRSIADFSWSQLRPTTKFFCWLAVHNKLWTKHGGQANPICQLCRTQAESVIHMLSECTYSTAIWLAMGWCGPPTTTSKQLSAAQTVVEFHDPGTCAGK
jgi:hypothetical protein